MRIKETRQVKAPRTMHLDTHLSSSKCEITFSYLSGPSRLFCALQRSIKTWVF